MVLLGALVNTVAIIIGTFLGTFLTKIPENVKTTIIKAIGLAVIVLGVQMGMKSHHFVIVIASLVGGAIIGEMLKLEDRLNELGHWIEKKVGTGHGDVAKAFVTATLLYIVGALAIIGALDSGLRHDYTVLYTKALLDGFCSLLFTTTFGVGVAFSAIPVFLYEGGIALFATQINHWVPHNLLKSFINEMTATGGVMILAIGLNLLEITKIRTANLLPGLLVVTLLTVLIYFW